jgi:hypothetical protein
VPTRDELFSILVGSMLLALGMWLLYGCVGKPAICATTWSASTGVEQSVYDGRVHPTAEVSVGGELGSDKCKEGE